MPKQERNRDRLYWKIEKKAQAEKKRKVLLDERADKYTIPSIGEIREIGPTTNSAVAFHSTRNLFKARGFSYNNLPTYKAEREAQEASQLNDIYRYLVHFPSWTFEQLVEIGYTKSLVKRAIKKRDSDLVAFRIAQVEFIQEWCRINDEKHQENPAKTRDYFISEGFPEDVIDEGIAKASISIHDRVTATLNSTAEKSPVVVDLSSIAHALITDILDGYATLVELLQTGLGPQTLVDLIILLILSPQHPLSLDSKPDEHGIPHTLFEDAIARFNSKK